MKTETDFLRIGNPEEAIMKIIYENNNNSSEGLSLEKKGEYLLMVNSEYDPQEPLASETLTIIIKNVASIFGHLIREVKIVVPRKERIYALSPWPYKISSQEYNVSTKYLFERGGRIFAVPESKEDLRELARQGLVGHDSDKKAVIIDPKLIGIKIKLSNDT